MACVPHFDSFIIYASDTTPAFCTGKRPTLRTADSDCADSNSKMLHYRAHGTAFVGWGRRKGGVKAGGERVAGVRSAFLFASPHRLVAQSRWHKLFPAANAGNVPTGLCKERLEILRAESQGSGLGFLTHE